MSLYYQSQIAETENTKLETSGVFPVWLDGRLIRNGPALYEAGNTTMRHWFDAFGMLHSFTMQNGEVTYQSKFIKSAEYLNAQEKGTVDTVTWGTASDPCRSIFRRFMANFSATPTNTNVSVQKIGDRYFTGSDIPTLNEYDIENLDTLSSLSATKGGVVAAHPAFQKDGSVWNMASTFSPHPKNQFIKFDTDVVETKLASFYPKKQYYFHSFGNTEKYMVSMEMPMYLSFKNLVLSGPQNKSFYECFYWDENAKNILHILDRTTGLVKKIPTGLSFFYFHTVNSYELGDELIIDLCGYKNNHIIDDFYIGNLSTSGIKPENKASLMRLKVNLVSHEVKIEDLGMYVELPAFNHRYAGTEYDYAYGIHSVGESTELSNAIMKYQFSTKTQSVWHVEGMLPGEPVFVPTPQSTVEDDGVLLVVCFDQTKDQTCLVVLNAQTMKELSRTYTPRHIPASLHGAYYSK